MFTDNVVDELQKNAKKFNKVVLWGFKTKWHTHRFIFKAYYDNLKKAQIPVVWVDDAKVNQKYVEAGDIVFTASGMHGKMMPEKKSLADYHVPVRSDVFYCLHAERPDFIAQLKPGTYIQIKFFNNEAKQFTELYPVVHLDEKNKVLYQPWGTDLLPSEFGTPVYRKNRFVFWVGSIWKGVKNEGNLTEIQKLDGILRDKGMKLIPLRFIPLSWNKFFIRHSRIAPAIGGAIQVETNYLPCRMFKNISYGQLGFSNIKMFNELFKDCTVYNEDVKTMVEQVLSLSKEEYIQLVQKQQEICKKYTIAQHLTNIFKYI